MVHENEISVVFCSWATASCGAVFAWQFCAYSALFSDSCAIAPEMFIFTDNYNWQAIYLAQAVVCPGVPHRSGTGTGTQGRRLDGI